MILGARLCAFCAGVAAVILVAFAEEPAHVRGDDARAVIAEDSWTLVVLPDIQSYVDHAENMPILHQMIGWIAENRESCGIALVLQVGDIVFQNDLPSGVQGTGDQTSTEQWTNAQLALHKLNGIVPYILVPGNHDYGIVDADNRDTRFNDYFAPEDNPLVDPAQGGILADMGPNASGDLTLENACYDLTAPDGRQLLILALEWGPRQAAVDWAKGIAGREEYRGHTKVLLTHAYLYQDNTRYDWAVKGISQSASPYVYAGTYRDTHDGQELWDELVRCHPGFELVFCGHVGGDMVGYLASENDFGQQVHQMLFNAQFLPVGGQGWLRLLEFKPDGRTVQVRTYSPYFALDGDPETSPWRTGADDEFAFELSPLGRSGG